MNAKVAAMQSECLSESLIPEIVSAHRNRRHFLIHCAFGMGGTALVERTSFAAEAPAAGASGVRWIVERISRGTDPLAGALIRQLTSATVISHAIYGEQLFCSADGNRIAFLRCYSTDFSDGPVGSARSSHPAT